MSKESPAFSVCWHMANCQNQRICRLLTALIGRGADVNELDASGSSCLHAAAKSEIGCALRPLLEVAENIKVVLNPKFYNNTSWINKSRWKVLDTFIFCGTRIEKEKYLDCLPYTWPTKRIKFGSMGAFWFEE